MMFLIPLLFSLSVHEWAHAWSAWRMGDDTAYLQGRMTLNPLAHIDPVGTVLLPLMGVPFGWAKPVPVNPLRFRKSIDIRMGMIITSGAGPVSNLVIALASALCMAVCAGPLGLTIQFSPGIYKFLQIMVFMNVILAFFNALPIPPLDGGRIADALMPYRLRPMWENFSRFGPLLLLAVIFMPRMFGFSLLDWPIKATQYLLGQLLRLTVG